MKEQLTAVLILVFIRATLQHLLILQAMLCAWPGHFLQTATDGTF